VALVVSVRRADMQCYARYLILSCIAAFVCLSLCFRFCRATQGLPTSTAAFYYHQSSYFLYNAEAKTGTTALEWKIQSLFSEICSPAVKFACQYVGPTMKRRVATLKLPSGVHSYDCNRKHDAVVQGRVYGDLQESQDPSRAQVCVDRGVPGFSDDCVALVLKGRGFSQMRVVVEDSQARFAVTTRDPIATCVSWHNYVSEKQLSRSRLNSLVKRDCALWGARVGLRLRIGLVWSKLHLGRIPELFVFEEMLKDSLGGLEQIAKWFGLHVPSDLLSVAYNRSKPETVLNIQQQLRKGVLNFTDFMGLSATGNNSRKVGTVKAEAYRKLLASSVLTFCEKACSFHLGLRDGYSFSRFIQNLRAELK